VLALALGFLSTLDTRPLADQRQVIQTLLRRGQFDLTFQPIGIEQMFYTRTRQTCLDEFAP
jgi:hypothetical protein